MLKLIARRLALLPVILLAVAAITFGLTEISPFDPVNAYVGAESQVSPGAQGGDRARVGARSAALRALRPLGLESRAGRHGQLDRRRRPARPRRDPRALGRVGRARRRGAAARARRRPGLRGARRGVPRHVLRLVRADDVLLQHRRAVVLGRAARAVRVLDRARLAAGGRHVGSARGRRARASTSSISSCRW